MSDITNEWRELRQRLGELICRVDGMNISVDSKLKKLREKEEQRADLQAQIDEAYNKGMQDLYDALKIFHEMPNSTIIDKFGSMFLNKIIQYISPQDLMYKLNQWKADKEQKKQENQEFHVGDEIICVSEYSLDYNKSFIYLGRDKYNMKMFDLYKMRTEFTNNFVDYRKTGKHYDSIPLPKEIE